MTVSGPSYRRGQHVDLDHAVDPGHQFAVRIDSFDGIDSDVGRNDRNTAIGRHRAVTWRPLKLSEIGNRNRHPRNRH